MLSSIKVHNPRDYMGRAIIKQPYMALQREHSPTKTKVDSYKDPSQVALYEDPNSIRFAKDSSKLVLLSHQYCDYTYPCQAQQTQDDEHQRRCSCLAQQTPQGGGGIYIAAAWRTMPTTSTPSCWSRTRTPRTRGRMTATMTTTGPVSTRTSATHGNSPTKTAQTRSSCTRAPPSCTRRPAPRTCPAPWTTTPSVQQ